MKRSADGQAIRLTVNAPHPLDNGSLMLQRFLKNSNGLPYAAFIWQDSGGNQQQLFMALAADQPEAPHIQIADARYDLEEIIETPFIVAIIRHNPAVPLILVSLLLASVATALLIKWLAGRFSAGASASPR
ncbi:MAG: hypothetical protein A2V90_04065 [Gammaproteobacteria bacterium RBG_16_57_12]|nr:MAG: hypothetical protein A2V90_04065 [Gammaproteobacteria bacterium RBG_16_57_12]